MKTYLYSFMHIMHETNSNMEEWKKRIKIEYKETSKLPRKKKKQRRKELKLDWQIVNYNPFNY